MKFFLLLITLLCLPFIGYNEVIIVPNGNHSGTGSLRQAINDVYSGDSIIIDFKDAIALNTPVEINGLDSVKTIGPYAKHMYFAGDNVTSAFPNLFKSCQPTTGDGSAIPDSNNISNDTGTPAKKLITLYSQGACPSNVIE